MAHLLYTAEQVAQSSLAVLRNQSTLARIVNQDFSREFVPGRGAAATVVGPVMLDPARVYTKANRDAGDAITYSDLYQNHRVITLNDQVYQAVKLPDDFTTFTLQNMETQVVRPMAESVSEHLNSIVADAFNGIATGLTKIDTTARDRFVGANGNDYASLDTLRAAGTDFVSRGAGVSVDAAALTATTNADVLKTIRAARRVLNERGVPVANRFLVVGSGWEAALMSQDILNKNNEAGTDSLLRQATLGTLYGFTIVVDYTIDPLKAFALERNAITLATRVTAAPRGAAFAATASAGGFTMRYLHDYDPDHLTDRAVIDLFAGAEVLDEQRVVVIEGTDGFEEPTAPAADPAA